MARFPGGERLCAGLEKEGFVDIDGRLVERFTESRVGRVVFEDPYLGRRSCSQLALLSEETYAAGLKKIEKTLRWAESRGETQQFKTEIAIMMWRGRKA